MNPNVFIGDGNRYKKCLVVESFRVATPVVFSFYHVLFFLYTPCCGDGI